MEKLHIWGFHSFLSKDMFEVLYSRNLVFFRDQPGLQRLSSHYDHISGLATFEVVTASLLDQQVIRLFKGYLNRLEIVYYPFSNEDESGDAHEAFFLIVRAGNLPSFVAEAIRLQTSVWFHVGRLSSSRVADYGNMIIISAVARADLPDLLVEQINRLVSGLPVYYKNHIAFERQTK